MSRAVRRVIVHHSAGRETSTVAQIVAEHKARGFSTIGYHWLVHALLVVHRADGSPVEIVAGPWTVSQGRPEQDAGAHDQGQNADSIGVCIAGDYTRGLVAPDGWLVLVATVVGICRRYGLTVDQVEGHCEHEPASTPTACPGFDPAELRAAVAPYLT